MKVINKILVLCLTLSLIFLTGCKKQQGEIQTRKEPITINYYKVFEPEENLKPLFSEYQKQNPHVNIVYRNFTDLDKYLDTVISELAEGGGPDIVSVPNTWVAQNYKKISPAPSDLASPQAVRDAFVSVVEKDNVFIDTDGIEKVFGIPLYVDTLALYYNDQIFEQVVPELGKPTQTWESIRSLSDQLTLPSTDNDLIRSGLAIGTGNGIQRSADIFSLMLLQKGVNLFDQNFTKYNFANSTVSSETAQFYNSFNKLNSGVPSWQDQLGTSKEKEIYAFATGKTAMIFGYSYLYQDILDVIELARRNGDTVINPKNVKITEAPQFSDIKSPLYLANYNSESVTRNSKNSTEAWKLITFLADPKNLEKYYARDFKPTSRRELIQSQRQNPIFGIFANQLGTATSSPLVDKSSFNRNISNFLDTLNQTSQVFNIRSQLITIQNELNSQIGRDGGFPPSKNKLAE